MNDEVHWMDEAYVGQVVRLEIPLKSVTTLTRVASELKGLAYQLECLARFSDLTPTSVMLEVGKLVRRTNKNMDKIRSRGRPKIGRQFRKWHKM